MRMNRRTFVRGAAGIAAAAALPRRTTAITLPSGGDPDQDELLESFRMPPKKFRPIARWWWPGDDVTEPELRREIGVLDEAGFGGAEIQAFFKGFNRAALSPEQIARMNGFATPTFFEHVRATADEARRHDMFIDYTFGSGWPFGGGEAIAPELAAIELRWSHCVLRGPAKYQGKLQIPLLVEDDPARPPETIAGLSADWADRMRKRSKIVAVVAIRGQNAQWSFYQTGPRGRAITKTGILEDGTAVDLTGRLSSDGTVDWDVPEGTWQVFVFVSGSTGQRVNGASGAGPQLVLDHLNAEAFRAHAARVGENAIGTLGEYFGNGIRAVFCDSLEVRANLFWSDDFLAEFQRRRGYALWPYLPVLQVQSVAEPFAMFFDTPVFDIETKGVQVRRDYRLTVAELMKERFYDEFNGWAHEHKLLARTQAHGAPVDVLDVYGDADIPETEQLYDQGTFDFLKLAASAAHIRGRAIVGSESFVWPGALYQTTPEKVKRAVDELITAGVNAIVYHGFAYKIGEMQPPGWHPFSGINGTGTYSSQFNELNPLWPYFAKLNAYITRLQFLFQTGRNVAAVALFHDSLTHGAEQLPPTPKLNQALMDAGYNYDPINGASLRGCSVRNGVLVTSGGAEYRALIVPHKQIIETEIRTELQRLATAGLNVVFVTEANPNLALSESIHRTSGSADCVKWLQRSVVPNVRFHGPPFSFIEQRLGMKSSFFLRNDSDVSRHLDASFQASGMPQLWDPWTGGTDALPVASHEDGWSRIQLELEPFGSALIFFSAVDLQSTAPAVRKSSTIKRVVQIGSSGWQFSAEGMTSTKPAAKFSRELTKLIDWSLDAELREFCGRGTYRTTFTAPTVAQKNRLVLDLGEVREVADVVVNGRNVTTLLLNPYRADVTEYLRPGLNTVEISVVNTLFNCMVLRTPRLFRPGPTGNSNELMSGGLLGPVRLGVTD